MLIDYFNSPNYKREIAKIEFVDILHELGKAVSVQYMEMLRLQWADEENREPMFREISELFYEQLSFSQLEKLHELLDTMSDVDN